ncbi:hypothetical protein [Desulfamplus magnetovallimortis]|uniref:hypothetical protein n=1 Tax=Desulfamplus magnetovallimortis TaxID=1246637 RepID=UPI0009BA3A55|nr:hypothetical protein [Desulfamplus magnetovallimortis]
MGKTRHIQARMSQRGIRQSMVDLTMTYGIKQQDKIILNKKGLQCLLDELQSVQKIAQKMMEKGGLVVVEKDNIKITTYHLNSYHSY